MDPNMNQQGITPSDPFDNNQMVGANATPWQDSSTHFRVQNQYQGPYPTSNPRMRQHGDFQQRGRYPYNKRGGGGGGHRPYYRERNVDQQQEEQSLDNNSYQKTNTNASNRTFNSFFRPNMLENPWVNMRSIKVPSNGMTLVFDSTKY